MMLCLPARLLTVGLLLTIVCRGGRGLAAAAGGRAGLRLSAGRRSLRRRTPRSACPSSTTRGCRCASAGRSTSRAGSTTGIATPFVLLFLAFAVAEHERIPAARLSAAVIEIALAVVAGTAAGVVGGWLLAGGRRGGVGQQRRIGAACHPGARPGRLLWLAGHRRQRLHRRLRRRHRRSAPPHRNRFVEPTEFTETFGSFLSLLVWAIFGAVLVD